MLLENFTAMLARNWTNREKAILAPRTTEVLKDYEAKFCVRSRDRISAPTIAWAALCSKSSGQ